MSSSFEVASFAAEHIEDAAGLLAARQRRLRAVRPELPAAFEEAAAHLASLVALLERDGVRGVVAVAGGELVGFLVGYPRSEAVWGRASWSPIEGCALADNRDAELMRDLYAAWSEHFVRRGFFRQYVHVPADDADLAAAWSRTGFGVMQAHAARDLQITAPPPDGVTMRRALPADIDRLEDLLPLISEALARPPAYAIRLPGEVASYRDSWVEELQEPAAHHWLAEDGDRVLAMATFYVADAGPMVPDGAWELSVAMTRPEARGRGLMRSLLSAGFAEAREAGANHCVTDWRTAALPTHRTWTALGFRPTHYRLHRHIDERIAWADGRGRESSV